VIRATRRTGTATSRGLSGWRRRGGRKGTGRRRWAESVGQTGDEVVGVGARPVAKARIGNPECRLGGRQIAVVEIEGEKGVNLIAQTSDRLITELPVAVVEDYSTARDAQAIKHTHRANPDTNMRRYRPPGGEVIEHVGHDRMGVSVPAGPVRALIVFSHVIVAIAVLFFEAPRA
jgi:hypothetical protein